MNNTGLWIIFFNNDDGKPKFWIGASASESLTSYVERKINTIKDLEKGRFNYSIPNDIKDLIKKMNGKSSIYDTVLLCGVEDISLNTLKVVVTEYLMRKDYKPCINKHFEWYEREKKKTSKCLTLEKCMEEKMFLIKKKKQKNFGVINYEGWEYVKKIIEDDEILSNKTINHIIPAKIDKKEEKYQIDEMTYKMLNIESILQGVSIERVVYDMLSEKSKEILKLMSNSYF